MKTRKIIICIGAVVLVLSSVLLSVFWYRLTPFYQDCTRVKVGMDQVEVENILSPYINNNRFYVAREGALWGPGLYVSSNTSGNGCSVAIKEGKVEKIEARFE